MVDKAPFVDLGVSCVSPDLWLEPGDKRVGEGQWRPSPLFLHDFYTIIQLLKNPPAAREAKPLRQKNRKADCRCALGLMQKINAQIS